MRTLYVRTYDSSEEAAVRLGPILARVCELVRNARTLPSNWWWAALYTHAHCTGHRAASALSAALSYTEPKKHPAHLLHSTHVSRIGDIFEQIYRDIFHTISMFTWK